jgi:hypothetical protein
MQICEYCKREYKNINSYKSHVSKYHTGNVEKSGDEKSNVVNHPTNDKSPEKSPEPELTDEQLMKKAVVEYLSNLEPNDPQRKKFIDILSEHVQI